MFLLLLLKISDFLPSHVVAKNILRMFKTSIQITIPHYETKKCVRTHTRAPPSLIPSAHHSFHIVMVPQTSYLTCTVFIDVRHSKNFFKKFHRSRCVSDENLESPNVISVFSSSPPINLFTGRPIYAFQLSRRLHLC